MPKDLIDAMTRGESHQRGATVRHGRVWAAVTGNVVRIAYQPGDGGGDVAVEFELIYRVSVRGDEPLTRAVLDFVRGLPGRTDAETLAEVGRVLDASYPNYVPSGLYSALVGG